MNAARHLEIVRMIKAGDMAPEEIAAACLTSYGTVMEIAAEVGVESVSLAPEPAINGARSNQVHDEPNVPATSSPFARPGLTAKTCQFPLGDPKQKGFRFCGSTEVVPGRAYCHRHCAACYLDQKEDSHARRNGGS